MLVSLVIFTSILLQKEIQENGKGEGRHIFMEVKIDGFELQIILAAVDILFSSFV